MRPWVALRMASFVGFGMQRDCWCPASHSPIASREAATSKCYAKSLTAVRMASPLDPLGAWVGLEFRQSAGKRVAVHRSMLAALDEAKEKYGRIRMLRRQMTVLAMVIAMGSGAARAARCLKSAEQPSISVVDNLALDQHPTSTVRDVDNNRRAEDKGMGGAHEIWSTFLGFAYLGLCFAWIGPLYASFFMADQKMSFYTQASFCCVWLMPPALLVSAHGLAKDLKALWPKILPACLLGVAVITLGMEGDGLLRYIPPPCVVAGIVLSCGAIIFSGRYGQLVGAVGLWCIVAAEGFQW